MEWVLGCEREKLNGTRVRAHASDRELTTLQGQATGPQHHSASFWGHEGGSWRLSAACPLCAVRALSKPVSPMSPEGPSSVYGPS